MLGVQATFTTPVDQGFGITRIHAAQLFQRLYEYTRAHGAVGIQDAALGIYGSRIELFELEWMFE